MWGGMVHGLGHTVAKVCGVWIAGVPEPLGGGVKRGLKTTVKKVIRAVLLGIFNCFHFLSQVPRPAVKGMQACR